MTFLPKRQGCTQKDQEVGKKKKLMETANHNNLTDSLRMAGRQTVAAGQLVTRQEKHAGEACRGSMQGKHAGEASTSFPPGALGQATCHGIISNSGCL